MATELRFIERIIPVGPCVGVREKALQYRTDSESGLCRGVFGEWKDVPLVTNKEGL